MTDRRHAFSAATGVALGIAGLLLTNCGSSDDSGGKGSGGSSASSGSGGSSGASAAGGAGGNAGSAAGTAGNGGSGGAVGAAGAGGAGAGGGGTGGAGAGGGGTGGSSGGGSGGVGGQVGDSGVSGTGGGGTGGSAGRGGSGGGSSGSAGSGGADGGAARSLGFIGCSMAENVAQGYQAVGGMRLWPPYGTGALVVQSWTNPSSTAWQRFDQQASRYGRPSAVWVQICVFANPGATYDEVKQLIANARQHAAPGATILISGMPQYTSGWVCSLAGANGPKLTDDLAKQAAADSTQNVTYVGTFGPLGQGTVVGGADTCHANQSGQQLLGNQAVGFFGR
jgi:hypothetical protein